MRRGERGAAVAGGRARAAGPAAPPSAAASGEHARCDAYGGVYARRADREMREIDDGVRSGAG